jgi:two-component sensor histidine kinase
MNLIITKKSLFSRITNPPKRNFEDYYQEARYVLSYKICLFLTVALGILDVILYFYYGPIYTIMVSLGFIGVLVSLIFIYKTGNSNKFAFSFNIFGALLCQLTLYGISDQPHIVDGLWMIINILFAFHTIDKKWAAGITIIHGTSLFIFYLLFYNVQIHLIQLLTNEQIIGSALNVLICFFVIFYLSWQNIKTTSYAQTQLKNAKEVLQVQYDIINKQNIEKTVMLKEIHHRVKNNLQVIISLLRLQSRELENEEAISKFRDTTSRVLAMALIHEKMYQSEELSKINLEEYFNSLIKDILDSYEVEFNVKRTIECKISDLGMKSIVPLALIFNELFSNSLKYAFTNIEDAEIFLSLSKVDEKNFKLEYSDNGKWIEPKKEDSFGLELIYMLTEQLDGTIDFSNSPQTNYTFHFKNSEE